MPSVAINGRFLSQPVTGVQRYAREVTAAIDTRLAEYPADFPLDIEVLVPPGIPALPVYRALKIREVGRMTGQAWEQIELPLLCRAPLLSLANTAPAVKRNQIVCIHDANTRIVPQSYSLPFRLAYRLLHPALGRMAKHITTVSAFSAGELSRFGVAPRDRITVACNGAEHAVRWSPTHTLATAGVASPSTIVLLGSRAPHKNLDLIFDLAPALAANGFRIAVVGSAGTIFSDRGKSRPHPSIDVLGYVPDDALAALLRDSLCLAFPSLTEGFGLPPLEAMTHGCPVVASSAASMPEVCGNAAIYADPTDPAAWLAAFRRLKNDESERQRLIALGRSRAPAFTWTRTADHYLDLLQRLVATDTPPARTSVTPLHASGSPVHTSRD